MANTDTYWNVNGPKFFLDHDKNWCSFCTVITSYFDIIVYKTNTCPR